MDADPLSEVRARNWCLDK